MEISLIVDRLEKEQEFLSTYDYQTDGIVQSNQKLENTIEILDKATEKIGELSQNMIEMLKKMNEDTAAMEKKIVKCQIDRKRSLSEKTQESGKLTIPRDMRGKNRKIENEKEKGFTGTLWINIISAKDILPCNSNGLSDPYCLIRIGKDQDKLERVAKTQTIIGTLNPEWKESFKIKIKNATLLQIRCMDWERFSQDEICGTVNIDLFEYIFKEGDLVFRFDTQGTINLSLNFIEEKKK